MRTSIIKIVCLILFVFSVKASLAGLPELEATCAELGFKKKTQAYGECVLELDRRASKDKENAAEHQLREEAKVKQDQAQRQEQAHRLEQAQLRGDGTQEHQMCNKFGFIVGTPTYSDCRLKIDIAKREQAQRQEVYNAEQIRYQEEQRRYEQRVAEYERAKQREKNDKLLRFSLALMGGTSPNFAENLANAGRESLGLAPVAPTRPQMQNFTITSPSGRMTNCTAVGNSINCF